MIEFKTDLWEYTSPSNKVIRCITTNGFVKDNGLAVMGRGTARQAANKFKNLPRDLGTWIRQNGNIPHVFECLSTYTLTVFTILTFPVKHNWWEEASLELIAESTEILRAMALKTPDVIYLLPKPGCGNGLLNWDQVKPIMLRLPDNVLVIDK